VSRFSAQTVFVMGGVFALATVGSLAYGEVPTMALRAVAINGAPIEATGSIVASPGDTIEVEIAVWGWASESPDGIESYSAGMLNRRGAVSGRNGTILPLGWDAPLDSVPCDPGGGGICPPETQCQGTGNLGLCQGSNHFPVLGARIDPNRSDYVFFGFETIEDTQTAELDYTYFGLTLGDQGRIDNGNIFYAGSITLVVSPTACGTFTFFLSRCSGMTLLGAVNGPVIEPQLLPLEIDVGACPLLATMTTPENCVVDARRAFATPPSNEALGVDRIAIQFDRSPSGTSVEDFDITVDPKSAPPQIVKIEPIGGVTLVLTLDHPIAPQHWTCIKHIPSTRRACFGSLPVDVNQDLVSNPDDIASLLLGLRQGVALSDTQCDLNRSLRCTPQDILEAVDLLAGSESTPLEGTTIPSTCPSDSSAIFRAPDINDLGACCNLQSGSCQENITLANCASGGGAWSLAAPCCATACTPSVGACCDESTGACQEGVPFSVCRGASEVWRADASCDAIECGLPRGACCDSLLGECSGNVLESQCQGAGKLWTQGATCGKVVCRSG